MAALSSNSQKFCKTSFVGLLQPTATLSVGNNKRPFVFSSNSSQKFSMFLVREKRNAKNFLKGIPHDHLKRDHSNSIEHTLFSFAHSYDVQK